MTKNQIAYDSSIDYSQIKLDTIEFEKTPFLTLEDIESYDTVNHIINFSKSKNDTSGLRLQTPINALDLEKIPFIAYNEIQSYDTTNHILELTINHDTIESRINNYGGQFVVSLDDKRQYSGLLIPITSSLIFNNNDN